MKHSFLILLIILGVAGSLYSQGDSTEIKNFSLEEAIEYSMQNNTAVINAELDIEAAKKEVWKTTAIGLPQATGSLSYQHLPGELPTINFGTEENPMIIKLGVKNSSTYSVTVSQLVFSGEYLVGLQASRTFLQLSQNSLVKNQQTTRTNVSSAYYTILLLEHSKSVLDSSLENSKRIEAESKTLAETGFMEITDSEQFEIISNTIENGINSLNRQTELAYRLFKLTLGLDNSVEVHLSQGIEELLDEVEYTRLLENEFILDNNIDYKILMTNEKISGLNLKREKSKFLPSLSAFYLYQDKTNKPDFDITFNHILGLNVSLPIFSSGQRVASVSQAKINLMKSTNTRTQAGESLSMAAEQAKSDFITAYESYDLQTKNLELSRKIYNRTVIKYREGVSSSMDVAQAHNQYLTAVNNHTTAIMEVLTAKTNLENVLNN